MIVSLIAGVACALLFVFVVLPCLYTRKQKKFEMDLSKSIGQEMAMATRPPNPQLAAALGIGELRPPMPPYRAGNNPYPPRRGQPPPQVPPRQQRPV